MSKSRKKFILSADDFGISPLANKNILVLLKAKKLDRVSLIVDGIFTAKELEKLRTSGVKIDLHLNTDSKKKHKKGIKESAFLRAVAFSLSLASKRMRPAYMEIHWQHQVEKFQELIGRSPDGLNSHQHIHFFPPYFRLITKLAQKKKISYIRFGQEGLVMSNSNVYRILSLLHKKNSKLFQNSGLLSSQKLVSLDWIKNIPTFLAQNHPGSIEIVCHPERKKEFELIKKYF
jgi:predicted glycoside hydrolase/deacetylase ChbG (UPF0249 family)